MSKQTHINPTPEPAPGDKASSGRNPERSSIKLRFKEVYEENSDALFRFAFYKLSDREKAKDVVQDTFVKVWEYMVSSEKADGIEIANIKALLYRIAANAIIDNYRKKKELSLDSLMDDGFDPNDSRRAQDAMMDESDADLVIKSIHALEEEERSVILMRYIDGLSIKEIASITGQRENTVSVRIHRVLKTLKEALKVDIYHHE